MGRVLGVGFDPVPKNGRHLDAHGGRLIGRVVVGNGARDLLGRRVEPIEASSGGLLSNLEPREERLESVPDGLVLEALRERGGWKSYLHLEEGSGDGGGGVLVVDEQAMEQVVLQIEVTALLRKRGELAGKR